MRLTLYDESAASDRAPGTPAQSAAALFGPAARRRAVGFIVLIGLTSLFADFTYEGGRSVAGPFLALLGASGMAVGFAAGAGELAGYAVRPLAARLAEWSGRYWLVMAAGYAVNLLAVPLLALAPVWPIAVALLVLERFGRGVRSPIRDAMLSYAATHTGAGWGFGLHAALDQTGAVIGPLVVSLLLAWGQGYRIGFAALVVPAAIALAFLALARKLFPDPRQLELAPTAAEATADKTSAGREFWLVVLAGSLLGAGFADFALIAFHLAKAAVVAAPWVPLLYAVAMAAEGASSLALGWLFDRLGMGAVLASALFCIAATPLVFLGGFAAVLVGLILWGIGLGAQNSVLKAALARTVAHDRRARAFATYDMLRGIAWFAGSLLLGGLYDTSIPALVAASLVLQVLAVPALVPLLRRGAP